MHKITRYHNCIYAYIYVHSSSIGCVALLWHFHWRRTKVETTGATQDYETLISRLFETFLYFETKKQVVPWHQWHHLVRRHCGWSYTSELQETFWAGLSNVGCASPNFILQSKSSSISFVDDDLDFKIFWGRWFQPLNSKP